MSDDPTAPPATPTTWDELRRLADEVRLKVHLLTARGFRRDLTLDGSGALAA